ncbi:MAG: hypothetical protein GX228_01015 [Firmicutes bacterium]|nr:hypothetical protein [Bacillota bacterium]NLL87494.1 hypothetical protein [Bacillota bacterium]HKM17883.1 hypothetical protein [Limnochordia bacterium]
MAKASRLGIICFLIILCITGRVLAEPSLQFLLESDAVYELKFSFLNQIDKDPLSLSIYTYDEQGLLLKLTRLYRGLAFNDITEMNVVFEAPKGFVRAEVVIDGETDPKQRLISFARLNRFDPDRNTELASMIFNEQVYTGLIVDARGLGLERGMSPRIWSEAGEMIYGGVAAPYDYVQDTGVILYGTQLSEELMQRVSIPGILSYSSPLVVKAKAVKGQPRTGVVVDQDSAERIIDLIKNYDFFAHYAVVFLVD